MKHSIEAISESTAYMLMMYNFSLLKFILQSIFLLFTVYSKNDIFHAMLQTDFLQTSIRSAFIDFNNPKRHTLHRLDILRKFGLIDNLSSLAFSRATSFSDLKQAYALCYRIFLQNEYIEPNFMGMRLREWEINGSADTFLVKSNQDLVGTTTIAETMSEIGLPSEWLYKTEIQELWRTSRKIVEACNEAVEIAFRNYSIPIELFRIMLAHSWHTGVDKVIAVVNKNHKTFYEFLYMVQIGTEKSYAQDHHDPVILMCLDCDLLYQYLSSPESDNGTADSYLREYLLFKNPYIAQAPVWEKKAKRAFQRQRIRERFLDEIRNTLVASVWEENPAAQPSGPAVRS